MEIPKNYLDKFEKKKKGPVNERQDIIQQCVDRINKDRKGSPFKAVSWKQINGKVSHLKGFELNWFFRECQKSANFSRYFFGKLKIQKEEPEKPFIPERKEKKMPVVQAKKGDILVTLSFEGSKKEAENWISKIHAGFKAYSPDIRPLEKKEASYHIRAAIKVKAGEGFTQELQGKLLMLPSSVQVKIDRELIP